MNKETERERERERETEKQRERVMLCQYKKIKLIIKVSLAS